MTESILSRRDLRFLLHDWLDVSALTERERFADHSRETFDSLLEVSEDIAREHFAPHYRKNDLNEPTFDGETVHIIPEVKAALDTFAESGLLTGAVDEEYGGIQLPHTVSRACFAWFQAANIATSSYAMLSMGNAALLLAHGTPEQIERYVVPELEGRFTGTMCLSEPEVGSSLSDVSTRAVPQDDGTYRVHGQKMWISGGEHELSENIVHLVLARAEGDAPGVKGLSLFIVPKKLVNDDGSVGQRNDVVLSGLNHKMGWRGTTNTLLNFGEGAFTPGGKSGAVGHLVGERGKGLAYMFHMMNGARIGVGSGAVALGYRGYLAALEYARDRIQGRPLEDKDPAAPPVHLVRHPDIRRMLLASKSYVEGGMALVLYAARLLDESQTAPEAADRERADLLLDVLTPLVKTWPSRWCLKANDLAIQVLGGAGYTRDHDVEQLYRDNRLNPIHEGTDGIQSLDLLGRKVRMKGGAGLRLLAETIRATTAKAEGTAWAEQAAALETALARTESVTATLWADGDPLQAQSNSWEYLEAVGHTVMAWLWLEQALAADAAEARTGDSATSGGTDAGATASGADSSAGSAASRASGADDTAFYAGKRAAARYFFSHELPRVHPQFDLLESLDRTFADLDDAVL
ncbi:acyl-CoA dehydrogenase [Brevibacterium salitolerans]|uniref:Acyl-CoA dehydrogenase n=1 Tax=Brevibacterium salitolerans TaxID=1403566 RepID=A0ABP5IPF4_9MICO